MIKITSGKHKNRNIIATGRFLSQNRIRPTANYTKQLIMNLIKNSPLLNTIFNLQDKIVVDVCCGTGAIGFEMLSNGAKKCYFIDSNNVVLQNVTKTAKQIGIENQIKILPSITHLRTISENVDLIFIDPPYQEQERILCNFVNIAGKSPMVNDNTLILLEAFCDPSEFLVEMGCRVVTSRKAVSDTYIAAFFLK